MLQNFVAFYIFLLVLQRPVCISPVAANHEPRPFTNPETFNEHAKKVGWTENDCSVCQSRYRLFKLLFLVCIVFLAFRYI